MANLNHRLAALYGLTGHNAIVTGAGQGIGKEIARLFAAVGARVVVADINATAAKAAAEEIKSSTEGAGDATAVAVDVSKEDSVIALFAAAKKAYSDVDILVNNAGIFPKYLFTELSPENWDQIQAVNLRGVFLCMREAIKAMKASGKGGSIVNISSVSSMQVAVFCNQAYGASKAGVNNLTRSCALEFARDKIRINAVMPGGVQTTGARQATTAFKVTGPLTNQDRLPLGHHPAAEDIALAVLFFASPASACITGQILAVDGGFQIS